MAVYDLPAYIDYILDHSSYHKVSYIGVSQGACMFFAASDVVHNLQDKVSSYVAMAPAMYIGNIISPFVTLLARTGLPQVLHFF